MNNLTWEVLESRCYTPYSGKTDICIIRGESETLYPGIRVENVSFPLSIDAVQSAVFSCLSEGDSPRTLILPVPHIAKRGDGGRTRETKKTYETDSDRKLKNGGGVPDPCHNQMVRYWCDVYDLPCIVREQPAHENCEQLFMTGEAVTDIDRLKKLTERCVIPYSSFPVTALLRADNGIFSGVNIETTDWQKGLCAERVAIAKAKASGAGTFQEIHVYAPQSDYVSPCGACRQVLMEHMPDGVMYLHHSDTECSRLSVSDLLPYQFKAGNLGHHP
ncbi:MAG: cytidine deaminase [Balneolaceae bacterium]|nr:MAG: cytidine deaminase [Balneolaceae bacterium]